MKRTYLLLAGLLTATLIISLLNVSAAFANKYEITLEKITRLENHAKSGNTASQVRLGSIYLNGNGVSKDYNKALKWLTEAAEQGDADSQFILGLMYSRGRGVEQNYDEMGKWLVKATNQDHVGSRALFLKLYHDSSEDPKDHRDPALTYMDIGHSLLAKAPEEAFRWFAKAAVLGSADGQFMLAKLYYLGNGVPQNYEEAFKWATKAAKQGHAESQYRLAEMYVLGNGVPENYEEGTKWLIKAAKQGHAKSQAIVGEADRWNREQIKSNVKR